MLTQLDRQLVILKEAGTRPGQDRAALMAALKAAGIPSVIYYPRPLHRQTAYAGFPCDPAGLPASEAASAEVCSLPMHPYLTPDDQDRVIDALHQALSRKMTD